MKKTTCGARGDKAKLGEAASGEGRIALRDEDKRHQKSEQHERADSHRRPTGTAAQIDGEELTSMSRQDDSVSDKGLEDFQQEELSGSSDDPLKAVNYSDTDEDEDEGLGDGNLGRSVREGLE